MTIGQLLREFVHDDGVRIASTLVALDFVLGVAAALMRRTFRLAFVADTFRNDVLGKLVPYFAVWAAVRVGGDVELGGVGAIEEGTLSLVLAALAASILNSLDELRLGGRRTTSSVPDSIAGPERPPAP